MMNLLNKAKQLEQEADDFGFRWETSTQIMAQIQSECREIEEHLGQNNPRELQEEIGDLFHAVLSLCIFSKLDPEETLNNALEKFERRLTAVKQLARDDGASHLNGYSFKELMRYWDRAKLLVG